MVDRSAGLFYLDPLDAIWMAAAGRIGLRVRRGPGAYAATDGAGTLWIGDSASLDPDDSVAQLVFHELCHSLVEGPDSFEKPDFGLDNTSEQDMSREQACLRVQALLADQHGLRWFMAPTTDHRPFFDTLGPDPLWPVDDPTVVLARIAAGRAERPPWAPHLGAALRATEELARVVMAHGVPEGASSLWRYVEEPAARHPLGFPLARGARASRRCGECAWLGAAAAGGESAGCIQAHGAAVGPDMAACERYEPEPDCQACGACCREAFDAVEVDASDPFVERCPELLQVQGAILGVRRDGDRCSALRVVEGPRYECRVYEDRPQVCRDLTRSSANCLLARQRVGLSR